MQGEKTPNTQQDANNKVNWETWQIVEKQVCESLSNSRVLEKIFRLGIRLSVRVRVGQGVLVRLGLGLY